jgi:Ca2+-transporting ATPase
MTDNKQVMAGLTSAEAKRLQQQYGKNELTPQKKEELFTERFFTFSASQCFFY